MTRFPWLPVLLVALCALSTGCRRSSFGPHEPHGWPLPVVEDGKPRLWVLSRQEEERAVGVGSGRRHQAWRVDTFFHFRVQAFDPVAARPLWERTVLTLGDPAASGTVSRVVGSAADGRLLGQQGDRVWLLVDGQPRALAVADGTLLADVARIEQDNPALKGQLPVEAQYYGFDRGLVFTSADGRHFVIRGDTLEAEPYAPPPPVEEKPQLKANGMPVVVPLRRALGREPARQARLAGRWLGLYSEKEALDAGDDPSGRHLRWPYTVLDEGTQARRGFWRARIVETQRFDERFERLEGLAPIAGTPFFLNGRFLENMAAEQPLVLDDPASVLVWHRTRIDRDGRLAIARVGADLRPLWTAVLPLSDSGTANPVQFWVLADRVVALGNLETMRDGVSGREPHLVSVALDDGAWVAWDIARAKPAAQ